MSVKILIIDDDDAMVAALRAMLESRGFDVFSSEDGAEGADICAKVLPDVVILDLYLPGDDGVETYRRIKRGGDPAAPPVILLSSLTEKQIQAALAESGAAAPGDAVFSKPVDPEALMARIEEMLSSLSV